DGTDCSATMVPITVLRMVPIQRYRQGGGYTSLFLCLKSVFFDAGYSGGCSKWIFTFIELDIQNMVLAVCDTDVLKYYNFKNTPRFLFDSPPLKTYHFSRFSF
ncbi:hypothetical protein ABH074_20730, partial [Bacteroides uniformis]